jgi:uncharacterized protein
MSKLMPQEIEVWYIIPALRRELARVFVEEYNLSQKEVAGLLGVTEAAISQYKKSKRATEFKSSSDMDIKIQETAKKILADKKNAMKYLYDLTISIRGTKMVCDLHRKHDSSISKKCDVCMSS